VSEKEEKKVTAPSKPSVPRVWLRLPPPSNVPSELITDRYAISITNALIAGVIPLNLHIRLQPNEANTEAFMKAVAPTGDQEMLSERLEPQILSALQGVHLNPDGSKVAMMTKGRGKEPKPVKMQGFVPSFKTSFGPNKGQSRPLELTIPYYRLSAVMNSPGLTVSYRAGKKYTAFLTSFVVGSQRVGKDAAVAVIVGLMPCYNANSATFETGGTVALLDPRFVRILCKLHATLQTILRKAFTPGEIFFELYGLHEKRGERSVGLPSQQISAPEPELESESVASEEEVTETLLDEVAEDAEVLNDTADDPPSDQVEA